MIKNLKNKFNKYFLVFGLVISVMGSSALAAVPGVGDTDDQIAYKAELDSKKAQPVKIKVIKEPTAKLVLDKNDAINLLEGKVKSAKIKIKPGLSNKQIEIKKKKRKEKLKQERLEKQRQAKLTVARTNYVPVVKVDRRTNFTNLYKKASQRFDIPWQILAAIHSAETGQSGNTMIGSYAGARGPMQFIPSTWATYGVDGDGDGVVNIYDVDDAVHSAARYLAANGGTSNIRSALYHYNHATWYVNKVIGIARGWGYKG